MYLYGAYEAILTNYILKQEIKNLKKKFQLRVKFPNIQTLIILTILLSIIL